MKVQSGRIIVCLDWMTFMSIDDPKRITLIKNPCLRRLQSPRKMIIFFARRPYGIKNLMQ